MAKLSLTNALPNSLKTTSKPAPRSNETNAAREAARARQPLRGVRGERGLALPAEPVQHDDGVAIHRALEVEQFARASVKAVQRFGGEARAGVFAF